MKSYVINRNCNQRRAVSVILKRVTALCLGYFCVWSIYSFRWSLLDLYPKISAMTSFRKRVSQRVLSKAPRKARESSMDNILNDRIFKQKLVSRLKWSRSFSLCNQIYWNWSRNARTSKSFRFVIRSDLSSRPVHPELYGYPLIKHHASILILLIKLMTDVTRLFKTTLMIFLDRKIYAVYTYLPLA